MLGSKVRMTENFLFVADQALNVQKHVYVFARQPDDTWLETDLLTSGEADTTSQYFGSELDADGGYLAVARANSQQVYVFEYDGNGHWQHTDTLDIPGASSTVGAVAIQGDLILVGTPGHDTDGGANIDNGGFYVFRRDSAANDGTWNQVAMVEVVADPGIVSERAGTSLAFDGNYAVLGNTTKPLYTFKLDPQSQGVSWTQVNRAALPYTSYIDLSGDTLIVGNPNDADNGANSGAVYIYQRQVDDTWHQVVKRGASDGRASDKFGISVAIHGDRALVGANANALINLGSPGHAYILERNSQGTWQEVRILTPSDGIGQDFFGTSVALTDELALIGSTGDDNPGQSSGAVYMYDFNEDGDLLPDSIDADIDGDGLPNQYETQRGFDPYDSIEGTQDTDVDGFDNLTEFRNGSNPFNGTSNPATVPRRHYKVYADDGKAGASFGWSVALQGTTAIVSALQDDNENGNNAGAAYVFERSGSNTWSQVDKLLGDINVTSDGNQFGSSIALDGDNVAIGSWTEAVLNFPIALGGAVYLFERSEGLWSRTGKISSPTGVAFFGWRVEFSGDQLLVAAPLMTSTTVPGQPVFVYERNGNNWVQVQELNAGPDSFLSDRFGWGFDIDGDRAVFGAYDARVSGQDQTPGAAFVFERDVNGDWTRVAKLQASNGVNGDRLGIAVALDGDRAAVTAPLHDENGKLGAVYTFERAANGTWLQTDMLPNPSQGYSFAFGGNLIMDGDRLLVSASSDSEAGDDAGRMFVYLRQPNGTWELTTDIAGNDLNGGEQFGARAALDGDYMVAGALGDSPNGRASGSAYFFFNDPDNDGVGDSADNCIGVANASQSDLDSDGRGDPCDLDDNADGILDLTPPPVNVTPGNEFSYQPDLGYLGPNPLTLSIQNKPAWLSFDPATGALTGIVSNDNYGTYTNIVISADAGDGQAFSSTAFSLNVVDARPPITVATLPDGSYSTTQQVRLICFDGAAQTGSGCAATYYTLDGSPPTPGSSVFSAPINIVADTVLKFYSIDHAGNAETAVNTATFNVDSAAPTITLVVPADDAILDSGPIISGSAADTGSSGLAKIEIQLSGDNGTGLNASGTALVGNANEWVTVCSSNCTNWQFNTSLLNYSNNVHYTVRARAVDGAGNSSQDSAQFLFYDGEPAFTTLSVNLSSSSILFGGEVDAALKLTVPGNANADLTGQEIELTITEPPQAGVPANQIPKVVLTVETNADGQVTLSDLGLEDSGVTFNKKGTWTVQAAFAGTPLYQAATSAAHPLLVGTSAGYAVLVEGRISTNEGLESHNKTANRIYQTLRNRNFVDQNIFYYNFNPGQDANGDGLPDNGVGQEGLGIDGVPGKATIRATIEGLATVVNNNPAPLYVIFVDHGNTGSNGSEFLLGNESITPAELDTWLDTFEASLTPTAAAEARVFINGSCYSGGFIPQLAGSGRVLISSAAANEVSYKGPLESDGIRVGEYFLEELFEDLDRGESLALAFAAATGKTELYTRESDGANSANPYLDTAVQHPLLEDNGDGIGSNVLQASDTADGRFASQLYLGTGPVFDTNSAENPAEVVAVTQTQFLTSAQNAATVTLTANDNAEVAQAIIEVRPPSAALSGGIVLDGGQPVTEQRETANFDRRLLSAPATNGCAANQFCLNYATFTQPGKYEVFYYVEDQQTGDLSPAWRSIVYKGKGSNQAPTAVALAIPANQATVRTVAGFSWSAANDPDGDRLTYTLRVCTDSQLQNNCIVQEELTNPIAVVQGLSDVTTYYWQVESVDFYGSRTLSPIRSFQTDDGNNVIGVIRGFVQSSRDFALLASHNVQRTDAGVPLEFLTAETAEGGEYVLITLAGQATLQASAAGFQTISGQSVEVPGPEIDPFTLKPVTQTARLDFVMAVEATEPADSDDDGLTDEDEVGQYGTNPNDSDSDDDGLTDGAEVLQYGTNPNDADTDDDGISDGDEVSAGSDPKVNTNAVIMQIIDSILNAD
ncbi:MAG: chitobiase/beta-hexosaminidase C-terminal domain-containing protein [Gammaproteobacteria bacterium]|nr:chitobiase/beta-hexosaminidase C-terminal domain-containing protein [Gammaproteobacteria bacterium]